MSSHSDARAFAVLGMALATILVSAGVAALPARADANDVKPGTPHAVSAAADVPTDQFIVGIKDKARTASMAAGEAATEAASKVGAQAKGLRQTATGAHVVKTDRALAADEAAGFLTALRADPDVEYAEPDAIMQTATTEPNDGLYPLQWDLWEEPASLRAPGAWGVSRGEGVVVAVVDTGITSHSELDANVLPGYDMISSAPAARDGDGRDADPTDEGDWVSAGQCTSTNGDGISSWHGTHVAGTIAAIADNNIGVTGVAPEAKILPMRALGACGGYSSDIADSIIWAAGGAVAGTSMNANPARVINLSLGGINACSATYQNAINFAYNSGAAVVVSAGNSNRRAADSSPANCQNVITVAASGRTGDRAPYSNYGSAVDVTAPGGDMRVDTYSGILSTSNFGTTTADEEAYEFLQGTSMAAPNVAGVAALMMSEIGSLMTPAKVEARLKETARPLESITCWVGCGSGLVDATAALDFVVGEMPRAKMTPAPVTFTDLDGMAEDSYTVPTSEGVQYMLGDAAIVAGTHPGSGTVSVIATAAEGYILADEAVKEWTHTFDGASAFDDVAGPVLVSSSVSPRSFNLADGPAVVTVSVRITDETGTNPPSLGLRHDASGQSQSHGSMSLVSGDATDGVWEGSMTIPQGAATGQWDVKIYPLRDSLGNGSGGFDTLAVLDVSGPPSDVAGPVLVSSSVSPTRINLADGPAVVTVSVRITDETGTNPPVLSLRHDIPSQVQAYIGMSLVSGDATDGVWEGSMTIPQGAATGQWDVKIYPLRDSLGNGSGGFDTLAVLEVTAGPGDISAPVLVTSSVSPTSFDLADGPAVVKVSVRLTDQTGASAPVVTVGHDGSGQSHGFGSMTLVSGDARDGVWERTVTIPQGSATGQWDVTLFPLDDVLGNSSGGFRTLATLEISGAPADVSGPVLVTSSVSPTSFDLADGPAVVKVSVRLTDQTGASAPVVTVGHDGSGQSHGFGSMTLVSGDARDGVWERTVTIPQGSATGQWDVTLFPLDDVLGNSSGGFRTLATLEISWQPPHTPVTPAAVVFTDNDGLDSDTYTVPATDGVEYLVGENMLAAGTHPGSGTVTVKARAKADYVLAAGAVAEWSHTFKATPYSVTPATPSFTDKDGTAEDTFTVPATDGVEYLVAEKVVAAGTNPGTGTVTVKAQAKTDYVLAAGAVAEWSHTFKVTPYPVTPAAVTFADNDGTASDTYTVPATEGVEYLLGGEVVAAGTNPGTGTMTVRARAKADFVLASGAVAEWSHTFKATPYPVTPSAVTFTDKDGTAEDTYTVPATDGVEYLVAEKVIAAGTYPGTSAVTVKARAKADYVLSSSAVAEWSHTFKATPYSVTPAAPSFTDKDGTAEDTYAVPATDGVEYLIAEKVVAAGSYPGIGSVTVKARAKTDFVLAAGAVAEWSHAFKATPYPVTPAAPSFTDTDGTAEDTYTVPATDGVEYVVGENVLAAGTHPGFGSVTVKARAKADYVLAAGAVAEWSHTFKATPYPVRPAAEAFTDKDGKAEDTYTVPATDGVEYLVGGQVVAAGTYPGTGTVTVTARAKADYVLASGAAAEWSHTFKATPYSVAPAAVVFTDNDGTASDTFTVPAMDGVEYVVAEKVVAAGTYPGTATVTVSARAKTDYVLASGAVAEWSYAFKATFAPVPGALKPVAPFRALDTRNSSPVAADSSVSFQVAGVNGIPADVSAVVFNLTVADAKSFGFVTAYPSGTHRPNASNVNFNVGQIVPNSVTVPVGADGKVTLFNRSSGTAHLLADVAGYYLPGMPTAAGAFQAVAPKRFLDTRESAPVGADSSVSFQVAGVNGIPADVSAVVFNLTVADAKSFGFVTAYPSGTARPNASNVNFSTGQIVPNSVTVPVGADGKITLFNRSSALTHLLADVSGYYLAGTAAAPGTFQAVAPSRFLDTRNSASVGADSSVSFQVAGVNGIPAGVSAVVFNLTVAEAKSFGFATAYASGTGRPNASNVNFNAGQIVPNSVTVPVGADGKVTLFNRSAGATHLLADISGYYLP
ncbi:UNVERIFIED_ORG: subtilisin family serine protease [Arthrobacter sp. UYCu721]